MELVLSIMDELTEELIREGLLVVYTACAFVYIVDGSAHTHTHTHTHTH